MPDEKRIPYAPTKPAMPAAPATVAHPAMTDRAMLEDLYRLVKPLTAKVEEIAETGVATSAKLEQLAANDAVIMNSVDILAGRITLVERRVDTVEQRGEQASIRAKLPSTHDLETKAELAETKGRLVAEVAAREALAVEVAVIVGKIATIEKDVAETKAETKAQTVALVTIAADTSKAVTGWARQHPQLGVAAAAAAGAFLSWLSTWLNAHGH